MAEKISTLIIKVDLQCCRCYKKIKKILCQLQDRWNIKDIVYDEKNNVVIVSGPFNPECLIKKLRCKDCDCKVIKDIQIKPPPKPTGPPPPPPKPDPPPPPKPDPPPPPKPDPPPPPKPDPPPPPKPDPPPPPKPDPPPPPKPAPPPKPEPPPPASMILPVCCWLPCPCPCYDHRGHGGCRCCTCGKSYEPPAPPPPPAPYYRPCCDGVGYKIVCEEDPQYPCAIM
ncbi:uncharacterized protein [Typha angustifolia]|uniref:uncharacterized protein n=1 Tax=Typha angustifolia TaxID=59011 RepID=UPI003C2DD2C4